MKRKKIKTILCHMAIITICAGVFCHGYINGLSISKYDRFYSYAEADNWTSCDTSDLVTAFRYYCKSRNLAIEGSVADAITSFTTTTFNNICSTVGIDPTLLQSELKKTTSGNLGLRFLFSQTGITAYNRIFAEFLQNNDLGVGDELEQKNVYSGEVYTDLDGNSCLIYIYPQSSNVVYYNSILAHGTPLKYSRSDLISSSNVSFHVIEGNSLNHTAKNISVPILNTNANYFAFTSLASNYGNVVSGNFAHSTGGTMYCKGFITVMKYENANRYFLACVTDITYANLPNEHYVNYYNPYEIWFDETSQINDADIYITTNNKTINNNNYNNNYTVVYNDGDYYEDDDEPDPNTPPGGGGGGGGDPDNWDPTTPTIPTPTNPNFPTVELPDIDIPDLPSLNLSLGDLRNKFPFSLPFDIIAVLNVLDGEPQAPHIEATVPIGKWYTWEMDFDFSEFDNYARIFRAFEFIGFCIGLVIFTVHFVKG